MRWLVVRRLMALLLLVFWSAGAAGAQPAEIKPKSGLIVWDTGKPAAEALSRSSAGVRSCGAGFDDSGAEARALAAGAIVWAGADTTAAANAAVARRCKQRNIVGHPSRGCRFRWGVLRYRRGFCETPDGHCARRDAAGLCVGARTTTPDSGEGGVRADRCLLRGVLLLPELGEALHLAALEVGHGPVLH